MNWKKILNAMDIDVEIDWEFHVIIFYKGRNRLNSYSFIDDEDLKRTMIGYIVRYLSNELLIKE